MNQRQVKPEEKGSTYEASMQFECSDTKFSLEGILFYFDQTINSYMNNNADFETYNAGAWSLASNSTITLFCFGYQNQVQSLHQMKYESKHFLWVHEMENDGEMTNLSHSPWMPHSPNSLLHRLAWLTVLETCQSSYLTYISQQHLFVVPEGWIRWNSTDIES